MEVLRHTIRYTRVSDQPQPSLMQRRAAGVGSIATNVVHDLVMPGVRVST